MNILFLTNSRHSAIPYLDASSRYRCYNFAEDLQALGHRADVAHINTFKPYNLGNYDVVSFLRPSYSKRLVNWLNICAQKGIMAIADYDDLIFSPTHASETPQALNSQAPIKQIETRCRNALEAMRLFDHITFSTEPLKQFAVDALDLVCQPDKVRGLTVLPNGLSRYWLEYNNYLSIKIPDSDPSAQRIGYLSGSKSHDRDFKLIAAKLFDILKNNGNYTLRITGDLNLDSVSVQENGCNKHQIEISQRVPFESLPSVIVGNSINLAPLESTDFNQCKSHIKFIESAAFGVPVVSSSIPDINRHKVSGLEIACSPEDWTVCIRNTIDPDYRRQCRSGLIQYARTRCSNAINTQVLLGAVANVHGEKTALIKNEYSDSVALSR